MFTFDFTNISTKKFIDNNIGNTIRYMLDTNGPQLAKMMDDLDTKIAALGDMAIDNDEVVRLSGTIEWRQSALDDLRTAYTKFQDYYKQTYNETFIARVSSPTSSRSNAKDLIKKRMEELKAKNVQPTEPAPF